MSRRPPPAPYSDSFPCPVCDTGTKGCSHPPDGGQMCRGEPVDPAAWKVVCDTGVDGFKLYRPVHAGVAESKAKRTKKEKPLPSTNWSARAVHFASRLDGHARRRLAVTLGVPAESASRVPMLGTSGDTTAGLIVTFPEVDADGVTVGVVERDPSRPARGEKTHKSLPGGNRGVTPTVGWDAPTDSPLLLVEGGSGTLAAAAAGLSVLGRPGADNRTAVGYLAEMIRKLPPARRVIVVGDMDRKVDEKGEEEWAGRDGMLSTADQLVAAGVPNPVFTAIMPNLFGDAKPLKDVRDGLIDARHGDKPWPRRGAELLAAVEAVVVRHERTAEKIGPSQADDGRGEAEPEGANPDRWVVPFDAPQRLAAAYLAAVSPPGSPLRLRHWRDEFHQWTGDCYRTVADGEVRARLNLFIAAEFERVQRLQFDAWKPKADRGGKFPQAAKVTTSLVTSTAASLASLCGVGMTDADAPAWLGDAAGRPPVQEVASFRNGLLHVATGRLVPPTPEFFNFSTLAFDYDPAAPVPAAWLRFLEETWPGDREAVDCLQEWFGYLLTPDTRQQKMLWLVGPPRSGKGTTVEVLMNLVGEANVSSPTLQQLAERFGLSPLVNTSVAWFDEPKISKHDNVPAIVGTIKRITGGSRVDIDRKGIPILKNVRLGCRFVLSANEVLELGDASGAMASRVVVISTSVSKIDREDKTLIDRLTAELPGIFNWALAGLPRLAARGRFVQPASGMGDAAQLKDLGSPTAQFLAECVVFDDAADVSIDSLFDEYKKWCEGENRLGVGTKIGFARDLNSLLHKKHQPTRKLSDGKRTKHFPGVRLRRLYETDSEPETISPQAGLISPQPAFISPPSERQSDERKGSAGQGVAEPTQVAEMISPIGEMTGTISPNATLRSSSTYVDSGLTGEMNHKLSVNIVEGSVSGVEGGHVESMGQNRLSSRHLATCSSDDLYFTSDIELVNYPPDSAPLALTVGDQVHYRVTPSTAVTLIALADRAPPDTPDRIALDAALATICDYLVSRYPPEEIAAAEARGAQPLPAPEWVPN